MSLQTTILDALAKEPKPILRARVLEVGAQVLRDAGAKKEADEFTHWFKANGAWLTEKVNG